LEASASVLLVEEPTQGIDVGTKADIHMLLTNVARQKGCAVVVASSEFEELIGLADTIHIMRLGRLVQTLPGSTATYREILEHALP
jgi:ABC-type sugar transport system ATPase subunit